MALRQPANEIKRVDNEGDTSLDRDSATHRARGPRPYDYTYIQHNFQENLVIMVFEC